MSPGRSRPLLAVVTGAVASSACLRARDNPHVRDDRRWQRQNFRGRTVSLAGGPALAAGLAAGSAVGSAWPAGVAAATAAGFGLYDDLAGDSHARGLRGHARAAIDGRLTTGLIKLGGLVVGGVAAAAGTARDRDHIRLRRIAADALLVAGMANLMNLLDLRPGRAAKAALALGVPISVGRGRGSAAAAATVGATAALIGPDLAERVMLGDCGANALGAALGASMCASFAPRGRTLALAGVIAATLASESVSFSEVIDRTPWLSALDAFGRRP